MAERDPRDMCDDPRNDGVQGGHGDDAGHFARGRDRTPAGDRDYFVGHAPVASDRASTEHRGHTHEQDYVDDFRRTQDSPNTLNDLGHPQNKTARADDYAHSNRETGGKPYNRRAPSTSGSGGDA